MVWFALKVVVFKLCLYLLLVDSVGSELVSVKTGGGAGGALPAHHLTTVLETGVTVHVVLRELVTIRRQSGV